ncbi:hypothetical protein ACEZCY_14575 [Streptacidiphilus sp. N1-12]|uniref:Uncharacterized protein n=2 Tax=Streptacidiphilus alkalitolerans TaxID=3342712 RepID=A0ABV6WEM6_9ACTN
MPSASAADRLRAFRAMEKRADTADKTAARLTAELAALTASSERQIANLRAEVDRLSALLLGEDRSSRGKPSTPEIAAAFARGKEN